MNKSTCLIAASRAVVVALSPVATTAFEGPLSAAPIDSVYKVEGKKDCFRSTNFYFGGQPTLETLRWLKSEGIKESLSLTVVQEEGEGQIRIWNKAIVQSH